MALHPLIARNRDAILQIAARHGAYNVRVFGSFARGEAEAESDVDVLIDAGAETTAWFPGGLVVDLEEILARRVDVVETCALRKELRDRILAEAVPL